MRTGLLVVGIIALVLLYQGCFAGACDRATSAALTEEARLAIDIRCRDQSGPAARQCRSMLKRLYLAGSLDPDTTLRTYCDSIRTAPWGGTRASPPEICVRRFGGWPRAEDARPLAGRTPAVAAAGGSDPASPTADRPGGAGPRPERVTPSPDGPGG